MNHENIISKLTLEEKIAMIHAAGLFRSGAVKRLNIPSLVMSDGPSGVRQEFENDSWTPIDDTTDFVSWLPSNTCLCTTWNPNLARKFGEVLGDEARGRGKDVILAPGINIKRTPLCGRNFEYYSEDPLISGICAAAETQGVQSHPGAGTTIKHFACNNLEDNRAYNNSHVTERTLREIYLKGFEIAIRKAQPLALMSSYNMLNGIHTANSVDLLTKAARQEWGFEGLIMTDWGTTAEPKPDLEGRMPLYGPSNAAACIKAGNDLLMPGSKEDVEEILASVDAEEGTVKYPITLEELRGCAERILRIIAKSNTYTEES